jgi:hypothetical protein
MSCEELQHAWELYALALADEPERTELAQHLAAGCPVCTAGVRRARAMNAAILASSGEAEPSKRLRKRILASVGEGTDSHWTWIWAAAAASFAVAAFLYMGQGRDARREVEQARAALRRTSTELTATAADRSRLRDAIRLLEQPDTEQVSFGGATPQPPRGRVIVNPRQGVLLIAANLAPTAEGRTYEMWLLPRTGAPRPAGLFQAATTGGAIYFLPGPVDRSQISAVAVTVEPAAGSAAPTTQPIIVARL